jgi:hypothetical protein
MDTNGVRFVCLMIIKTITSSRKEQEYYVVEKFLYDLTDMKS